MNCRNFKNIKGDLARGALMEASEREGALAHADACAHCTTSLADERALIAGLHAMAAEAKSIEAPARIEATLLAAFRAKTAAGGAVVNAVEDARSKKVEDAGVSAAVESAGVEAGGRSLRAVQATGLKQWSWFKTFGTAATAAAAAVILLMLIPPGTTTPTQRQPARLSEVSPAIAPPVGATADNAMRHMAAAAGIENVAGGATAIESGETETGRIETTQMRGETRGRGAVRATPVVYNPRAAKAAPRGATSNVDNGSMEADEIATEFIPLGHGGPLSSGDGGQVVRVELPRSALVSLGLPMNVERASERVKADVLVGDDGMARAIRFVR